MLNIVKWDIFITGAKLVTIGQFYVVSYAQYQITRIFPQANMIWFVILDMMETELNTTYWMLNKYMTIFVSTYLLNHLGKVGQSSWNVTQYTIFKAYYMFLRPTIMTDVSRNTTLYVPSGNIIQGTDNLFIFT